MRRFEVEILEDNLDDDLALTRSELGLPIDLTREELEQDDDLGFRSLFEHPEAFLASARWPDAA